MSFHPGQNLPDCMLPDGGRCCAGHAAVCADWYKQRECIREAIAALRDIIGKRKMDAVAAVSMKASVKDALQCLERIL